MTDSTGSVEKLSTWKQPYTIKRRCACGCGQYVTIQVGPRYINATHRTRAYRKRNS